MIFIDFLPLYIDPGTGSMLFSLFIGVAAALSFGLRAAYLKLKFVLSGGKVQKDNDSKSIPYVIFSDHKRYWNVFKPICDEFEKRQINLVFYTASSDDPALKTPYKYVKTEFLGENNKPFARLNFLHADILLATTPGLGVYQWKRSKNVKYYVHIPHSVSDLTGYRMFGLDHYDAVLATGVSQEKHMRDIEELRPSIAKKEFVVAGSTYLDEMRNRLESSAVSKTNDDRKIVLVAPSWGKSSILSKFGEKFLQALRNTGFNIIVRPHPQSVVSEQNILKPLEEKFSDFTWNYDNDNFEVLKKADIMITDFSGVMFDYALVFDKPFIYADTHFDKSPYDVDWLKDSLWEIENLPKFGIKLEEEQFPIMHDIITKAMNSEELQNGRNEIRNLCWQCRGSASKNVVDYMVKKRNELLSVKNGDAEGVT